MTWLVAVLFLVVLLELIAGYLPIGWLQKILAIICIILIGVDSILIVGLRPAVWTIVLGYFSVFRIVNLCKLIDARKQIDYLRSTFIRASMALVIYSLGVVALDYLLDFFSLSYQAKWACLVVVNLVGLVILAMSLRRSLIKTRPKIKDKFIENDMLPDVTVAIPARNETEDLEQCLSSLVASDYPKLEILVLDDCSQEKRTPEIIRQFAQDGVRFLAGKVPGEAWTAKNYAYEQLMEEASGDVILFCGVDIRFERQTIRRIVGLKIVKKKSMLSLMPVNGLKAGSFKRLLLQPVRYLWELGLPRRSLNRPPVLSSCWLIDKQALKDSGTFKAVSRSIVPERYFARQCALNHDGYSFVCLGQAMGLVSNKSFSEQYNTATRTRYPLLSQRLDNVSSVALVEAALFVSPIGLFIYGLVSGVWELTVLSVLCIAITSFVMFKITKLTYGKNLPLSLVSYPLIFVYDMALSIYSMWCYEFSEMVWKGRNVCIPAMQIVKNLPKTTLDSEL